MTSSLSQLLHKSIRRRCQAGPLFSSWAIMVRLYLLFAFVFCTTNLVSAAYTDSFRTPIRHVRRGASTNFLLKISFGVQDPTSSCYTPRIPTSLSLCGLRVSSDQLASCRTGARWHTNPSRSPPSGWKPAWLSRTYPALSQLLLLVSTTYNIFRLPLPQVMSYRYYFDICSVRARQCL